MSTPENGFWRMVAEARRPDRLFAVRSNNVCGFYAGLLADGSQVLIGRSGAEKILLVLFNKGGDLSDVRRHPLPRFRRPPERRHREVNDAEFHDYLLQEFGFRPGLVQVHRFAIADEKCIFAVDALPWHVNQSLAELAEWTVKEQAEFRKDIRQFIERGVCVLHWRNDWWVLETNGVEAGWSLPG
jgi:hypothetical protein